MNVLKADKKILLLGIGNNGRSDDALGWKFVEEFTSQQELFDVEYRYQLQVEDALQITEYDTVIFVDASHTQYTNGYSFYECTPNRKDTFTTHSLEPETVLWLANDLFNQLPKAYVMAISGMEWELHQGLTEAAQLNFERAIEHFKNWISENKYKETSYSR